MGAASPRMNCCDVDDVVSKKLQVGQLADPELKKKEKKNRKRERRWKKTLGNSQNDEHSRWSELVINHRSQITETLVSSDSQDKLEMIPKKKRKEKKWDFPKLSLSRQVCGSFQYSMCVCTYIYVYTHTYIYSTTYLNKLNFVAWILETTSSPFSWLFANLRVNVTPWLKIPSTLCMMHDFSLRIQGFLLITDKNISKNS